VRPHVPIGGILAEQGVGKRVALGGRDRGQVEPIGDVAHGIDVVLRGAQVVIHQHRAILVRVHAGRFEAKPLCCRYTPGCEEHQVGAQRLSVAVAEQPFVAVGFQLRRKTAGMKRNALCAERFRQRFA